jgi:hypothetical protein
MFFSLRAHLGQVSRKSFRKTGPMYPMCLGHWDGMSQMEAALFLIFPESTCIFSRQKILGMDIRKESVLRIAGKQLS